MNPTLSAPTLEATIARVPHGPVPHAGVAAHPAATAQTSTTGLAGKSAAEANEVRQAPLTAEQKTAGTLRSVKSTFMMPAQWEFFGMLGGGILGWGAKKLNWQRAQAGIAIGARAPVNALRHTTLSQLKDLPENFSKEARLEAIKVGGKAADWFKASEANTIAEEVKPLTQTAAAEVTGFAKTVQNFSKKLHGSTKNKHNSAIDQAIEAGKTEHAGLQKRVSNFFTRAKPSKVEAGALGDVLKDLETSKDMVGIAKTAHLKKTRHALETIIAGEGEIKARAGNVMKHFEKAFSSAGALETYEHAMQSPSLKAMARTIGGRIPLYNALLTVGIAAGMGAVLVTAKGENKESKAAFKKLSAELSNQPDSHFLKSVKAAQKAGKHWSGVKTGMRLVGEGAEGGMWMMHNGGGMGMMGAMMLPQLVETMVPGNTMLGALEALDKSDQGKVPLKPAERVELMTQLVGGIESVAKNGGVYNRLAKAVAAEMQERGYKYHDVVQLLGNDEAFGKFATEVSAKQKAEAAKRAEEIKSADAVVAAAAPAATAETHAPMVHAAPTTRIGVGAMDAQHKGMVVDNRHLAMA